MTTTTTTTTTSTTHIRRLDDGILVGFGDANGSPVDFVAVEIAHGALGRFRVPVLAEPVAFGPIGVLVEHESVGGLIGEG